LSRETTRLFLMRRALAMGIPVFQTPAKLRPSRFLVNEEA